MKIFYLFEEIDLCKRLKKNKKIYLDPILNFIIGGSLMIKI